MEPSLTGSSDSWHDHAIKSCKVVSGRYWKLVHLWGLPAIVCPRPSVAKLHQFATDLLETRRGNAELYCSRFVAKVASVAKTVAIAKLHPRFSSDVKNWGFRVQIFRFMLDSVRFVLVKSMTTHGLNRSYATIKVACEKTGLSTDFFLKFLIAAHPATEHT